MMRRLALFFALIIWATPVAAEEQQVYEQPDAVKLVQSLFRFGAISVQDDAIIDDYAKIAECNLYQYFYKDDFKWNQLRTILRRKITSELPTYPTAFAATGRLHLDRYDFESKIFRLGTTRGLKSVNSFLLLDNNKFKCGASEVKNLPSNYVAVIGEPVTVEGFEMSEEDARALLERMKRAGNVAREILVRFNLRILFIDRILVNDMGKKQQARIPENVRLDAQLDSIEFFEDKDMTRRIYVYEPH